MIVETDEGCRRRSHHTNPSLPSCLLAHTTFYPDTPNLKQVYCHMEEAVTDLNTDNWTNYWNNQCLLYCVSK